MIIPDLRKVAKDMNDVYFCIIVMLYVVQYVWLMCSFRLEVEVLRSLSFLIVCQVSLESFGDVITKAALLPWQQLFQHLCWQFCRSWIFGFTQNFVIFITLLTKLGDTRLWEKTGQLSDQHSMLPRNLEIQFSIEDASFFMFLSIGSTQFVFLSDYWLSSLKVWLTCMKDTKLAFFLGTEASKPSLLPCWVSVVFTLRFIVICCPSFTVMHMPIPVSADCRSIG